MKIIVGYLLCLFSFSSCHNQIVNEREPAETLMFHGWDSRKVDSVSTYCWCYSIPSPDTPRLFKVCNTSLPITSTILIGLGKKHVHTPSDSSELFEFLAYVAQPDSIWSCPPHFTEDIRISFLIHSNGTADTLALVNYKNTLLLNHDLFLRYPESTEVAVQKFIKSFYPLCFENR